MRKEAIRKHIDRKIVEKLPEIGFDRTRQDLLTVCRKFEKRISSDIKNIEEEELINAKNVKDKYFGLYVLWAHKRIIDLYKLEIKDIRGFTALQKFQVLKFKEKIESNSIDIS